MTTQVYQAAMPEPPKARPRKPAWKVNIDPELRYKVRLAAAEEGTTIEAWLTACVKASLALDWGKVRPK